VGEDRTDAHRVGKDGDRLTIAEAATLLGVHKNTVRNRIKNGAYRAELVQTERGPTYLIERESLLANLTTNTLSSASQDVVSPQAMDFVQELLRPFVSELGVVREELGAERARRQMAEERVADLEADVADLEADVADLEAELEAFGRGRGSPQRVEEASDAEPQSASGGFSQGEARPRAWWRTRIGSIIGACSVLVFLAVVGFVLTTLILR
jgi:excisionase family DNA binding protein